MLERYSGTNKALHNICLNLCIYILLISLALSDIFAPIATSLFGKLENGRCFHPGWLLAGVVVCGLCLGVMRYAAFMPCSFKAEEDRVTFRVGGLLTYSIKYSDISNIEVTGTRRTGFVPPVMEKPGMVDWIFGSIYNKNGDGLVWQEEVKFVLRDKNLKFTALNISEYRREEFDTPLWKVPYQYGRFSELKKYIEEKKLLPDQKKQAPNEIIDGLSDWLDYSHK